MKISSTTFAVCALVVGCEQQSLDERNRSEQQELAAEQAEERQELTEEQREENQRAQRRAQEELRGETEDLREERADVNQQAQVVSQLLARACEGVTESRYDECPIQQRDVTAVRDIDDGVQIQMAATVGSERDLQGRVDCYQARYEMRAAGHLPAATSATGGAAATPGAVSPTPAPGTTSRDRDIGTPEAGRPAPGAMSKATPGSPGAGQPGAGQASPGSPGSAPVACLLDLTNVDIDVDDDDGRVEIEVTSDDDARVSEIRNIARQLSQRQASLR